MADFPKPTGASRMMNRFRSETAASTCSRTSLWEGLRVVKGKLSSSVLFFGASPCVRLAPHVAQNLAGVPVTRLILAPHLGQKFKTKTGSQTVRLGV